MDDGTDTDSRKQRQDPEAKMASGKKEFQVAIIALITIYLDHWPQLKPLLANFCLIPLYQLQLTMGIVVAQHFSLSASNIQHWVWLSLGAVKQQAITWINDGLVYQRI